MLVFAHFVFACFLYIMFFVKHLFLFLFSFYFTFYFFLRVFTVFHRQFALKNVYFFLFLFLFFVFILPASCNIKRTPGRHPSGWVPARPTHEKNNTAPLRACILYIMCMFFLRPVTTSGT